MERCSYFIKEKALFGSFPTQEAVSILEENGVRCFVDLTGHNERRTTPYHTNYTYIKYPITDRKVPNDWRSFAQLILEICYQLHILNDKEKIYIHCKGGHGRSGIVVASILCQYYKMTPEKALQITTKCHFQRKEMREKWRRIGSPQSKSQKDFVKRFFRPLKYGIARCSKYTEGLSNFTDHPVTIEKVGTFPTAYHAFQFFRDPNNKEYVNKLLQGEVDPSCVSKQHHSWEKNKKKYMYNVLYNKFTQYPELKDNLINTGLRPLVKYSKDSYWGDGGNGQGKNIHGHLLSKLRIKFLREDFQSQE